MYMTAHIFNAPTQVCVDTGAGVSIIADETFQGLVQPPDLQMYTGSPLHSIGKEELEVCSEAIVPIQVGKAVRAITLVIVRNVRIGLLLGNNALQQFRSVAIDYSVKTMTIAGEVVLMSVNEAGDWVAMEVNEGVTIPPRSARFMQCVIVVEVGEVVIVLLKEDEGLQLARAGAVVANGLGRMSKKKGQTMAFTHVVNPGQLALRLKVGWTVVWLELQPCPKVMAILALGEEELL